MALTPEQIELRDRVAKLVARANLREMKLGRRSWCGCSHPGSAFWQEMQDRG